ncbi:MAG: ATP-binding protein, partial [Sphingomonadaceae bacterium]
HVEGEPVRAVDLAQSGSMTRPVESSAEVAARVAKARARQTLRAEETGARSNAELNGAGLDKYATPDEAGQSLLLQAADTMHLSARGYTRLLRVARTIADLAGTEQITRIHVAEALSYRRQPPRA